MTQVQAFAGDALTLGKAFTRADVVVHCIQFPNHPWRTARKGRTYMEVDGQGTVGRGGGREARRACGGSSTSPARARARAGPQPWFRAKDMAEAAIQAIRPRARRSCGRPGSTGPATAA